MAVENAWQYSRWVYVVGRSLAINNPVDPSAEKTAVELFVQQILNPSTGSRKNWLSDRARSKCIRFEAGTEPLTSAQPSWVEAKLVQLIGKDFKKIPMTTTEKAFADTLIAATGNRYLGAKGNTI